MIKRNRFSNEISVLTMSDFSRIVELEKTLTNSELCYKSYEEKIIKSLHSACSVGLYADNTLVAYSLCFCTGYRTGEIEKCFVMSEYRGMGIQVNMLLKNIDLLERKNVTHIHTTVSPVNEASLKSFKRAGFVAIQTKNVGQYPRIIMSRYRHEIKVSEFIDTAKRIVGRNYAYLYGGKGDVITAKYVVKMASLYPNVYTEEVIRKSFQNVGRVGIDCSGLITISARMPQMSSDDLLDMIDVKYSTDDRSSVEDGMVLFAKNHVAVIHVNRKNEGFIIEAKDTFSDLMVSAIDERILSFECYGRLKNVSYVNANRLS